MLQNPQIQCGLHQKEAMFTQKSCLNQMKQFYCIFFFLFAHSRCFINYYLLSLPFSFAWPQKWPCTVGSPKCLLGF